MRVPNRGWDETPRGGGGSRDEGNLGERGRGDNSGAGGGGSRGDGPRRWDSTPRSSSVNQTPRSVRGGGGGGGGDGVDFTPNQREWEEEQVRLDRDWYENEGGVVSLLSSLDWDFRREVEAEETRS